MPYDLLIKNGHVLDPGQSYDGLLDIAISNGRIVALDADLPAVQASHVIDARGANRYVTPGLIDLHTHTAYGATTPGVGLDCSEPDLVGVSSGVTTVVDTGSVGVTNIGIFGTHIIPNSKTRVICYINAGSLALTTQRAADVMSLDEVDRDAVGRCIQANPGLISGVKLRVTGPFVLEQGEEVIRRSKVMATDHQLPFMAHVGNRVASIDRGLELTNVLFDTFEPGDILTHLCTPHAGGVMDKARRPLARVKELQSAGVVMDAAPGRGNFSIEFARIQADAGLYPDTISTDMTPQGYADIVYSLLETMSKFLSIGYSVPDVVRMTTINSAKALNLQDQIGTLEVGREADISIFDVVEGVWHYKDTVGATWTGEQALIPVQTIRNGEVIAPHWGPHPWGWLPNGEAAS